MILTYSHFLLAGSDKKDIKISTVLDTVQPNSEVYIVNASSEIIGKREVLSSILSNFGNYKNCFTIFSKIVPVKGDIENYWYFELRFGFFRYWTVVKKDVSNKLKYPMVIKAVQVHDQKINDNVRDLENRFFSFEDNDFMITFIIAENSNDTTALQTIIQAKPTAPIPKFLFNFAMKILVPRIFSDIQNYINKTELSANKLR